MSHFLAVPDTDQKHEFFLTDLTYLSDNLTNTQTHKTFVTRSLFTLRCSTAQRRILSQVMSPKAIQTEAIEPEGLEPRKFELVRNLGTDPYQIQERFMRNNFQNPITEDVDEFGKVGAKMSYIQSQTHSDYDSAGSIADSDLEDGQLRKMLASPLYMQSREDCKSSRIPTVSGKPTAMIQERGPSSKRTQADLRERLMSSSSQEPRASGNPAAMFSSGNKEPGNQFKSSVFKHADRSNMGRSFLEGNKGHFLSQASTPSWISQ